MRTLDFLALGLGAGAAAGLGAELVEEVVWGAGIELVRREGGGEGRRAGGGGGGATGEEERVIVSLSGAAAGWFRVCDSGLAVGGGVVGLRGCARSIRRIKPPSVREGRELGSGGGEGRAVGEVVSVGGVGSEC